jgi:predicted AlkP superfamily phosphohydrolase/phosphomutase
MVDIDWTSTMAYRVPLETPAEGIVINLAGRQPQGIVPSDRYEPTVEEIRLALEEAKDPHTGDSVVKEVFHRDEIYTGPYTEKCAADLVVMMEPSYKGAWGNNAPTIAIVSPTERAQYRGSHTMDGIFSLAGPGVRQGATIEGISIVDVMPTLLHALGLPVPEDTDGQVQMCVFEDDRRVPVRYVPPMSVPESTEPFAEDEEEEIIDRLRGLGYLE